MSSSKSRNRDLLSGEGAAAVYFFAMIFIFLAASSIPSTHAETEFSESLRSVSVDTKVHIDAGKEDCYYQYIFANAVLYVDYQVLKGSGMQIGFSIRTPDGVFVVPPEVTAGNNYHNGNMESESGYYAICLDNTISKFAAKLVSLYMVTYNSASWEKFADELGELEASVGNSTSSLSQVDSRVNVILQHLQHSRSSERRDYLLLESVSYYVNFFSCAQCLIIIVAGIVHVTILKSLFKEQDNKNKNFKIRL